MKYITIIILFFSNLVFSQKGIVEYGYIEAFSIGNAKGPDYNAYMIFNKSESYYVTAKDSLETPVKTNTKTTFNNDDSSIGTVYNNMKVSEIGDQVLYNIHKDSIWSNFLYRKQIYVEEIAPKINWKIEKETKKIGKLTCKKATTHFRGRNYSAWFTTDIPLPFGPWKLNGLPGLILEVYDTNKNVYWYFKRIEYPTENKETIKKKSIYLKENMLTYSDLKDFQKEEQDIVTERGMVLKKQFPEIEVIKPSLSEMFIECE